MNWPTSYLTKNGFYRRDKDITRKHLDTDSLIDIPDSERPLEIKTGFHQGFLRLLGFGEEKKAARKLVAGDFLIQEKLDSRYGVRIVSKNKPYHWAIEDRVPQTSFGGGICSNRSRAIRKGERKINRVITTDAIESLHKPIVQTGKYKGFDYIIRCYNDGQAEFKCEWIFRSGQKLISGRAYGQFWPWFAISTARKYMKHIIKTEAL